LDAVTVSFQSEGIRIFKPDLWIRIDYNPDPDTVPEFS
jgi:hypothetical protein